MIFLDPAEWKQLENMGTRLTRHVFFTGALELQVK
jgi:hypothetical protein